MTKRSSTSTDLLLSSAFLPVHVVPDDEVEEPSSIEIVLPGGPTLRVNRGFDPLTLHAVLAVMESRRC